MFGPVHRMVGRGHDIGPVRLDVGQVQAPRPLARLLDELDRARSWHRASRSRPRRPAPACRRSPSASPTAARRRRPRPSSPIAPTGSARRSRVRAGGRHSGWAASPRRDAARRAGPRHRSRIRRSGSRCPSPGRSPAAASPRHPRPYGSCRTAPCAGRAVRGDRPASSRPRAAESCSRSSRASARSGRCRSSSGSARRSATGHRRGRTARRGRPARRYGASSDGGGRRSRDSRSAVGRT